jgi:hypothetical protein
MNIDVMRKTRTITRLRRIVPEVEAVQIDSASNHYHLVTIGGVTARAHVGDGFLTFGVRRYRFVGREMDPGIVVVPVPKMSRHRGLIGEWLTTVHARAADLQNGRLVDELRVQYAQEMDRLGVLQREFFAAEKAHKDQCDAVRVLRDAMSKAEAAP